MYKNKSYGKSNKKITSKWRLLDEVKKIFTYNFNSGFRN